MSGYTKQVSYRFEINCSEYQLIPLDADHLGIEECDYSGSDDCHASGLLKLVSNRWEWDYGASSFDNYGNNSSDAVLEYVNLHPIPNE